MWHLYILYSSLLNKYYIGHTGDIIAERVRRHNTNHRGFTGGMGDWKLVYSESFDSKEAALGVRYIGTMFRFRRGLESYTGK